MSDADTPADSTPAAQTLADELRKRLADAPAPLPLAKLTAKFPKPLTKKMKAPEVKEAVRAALEDDVRAGRAFSAPSGKAGETRYWAKDEKHALREEGLRLADTPDTLANLAKKAKGLAGSDPKFVEDVLRELIADEKLFDHPPKKKGGANLLGAGRPKPPPPPPHPLDSAKNRKKVDTLVKGVRSLLDATGVAADDLFERIRAMLGDSVPVQPGGRLEVTDGGVESDETSLPTIVRTALVSQDAHAAVESEILKTIEKVPVMSIADLRKHMRPEHQGKVFDEAVLNLDDQQRVVLHQDANPLRYTEAERAEFVAEGGSLFTAISNRS